MKSALPKCRITASDADNESHESEGSEYIDLRKHLKEKRIECMKQLI
jgi:hypothetical protein